MLSNLDALREVLIDDHAVVILRNIDAMVTSGGQNSCHSSCFVQNSQGDQGATLHDQSGMYRKYVLTC